MPSFRFLAAKDNPLESGAFLSGQCHCTRPVSVSLSWDLARAVSDVSTTLGIYSHVIPLLKRDATERMNALLGPAETAVNTPTGTSSGTEG